MSISVEEFLKQNPVKSRKKSQLLKFEQEIKMLREAGATYAYIQKFLEEQGVKISIVNIRQFVIKMQAKTAQPENPTAKAESNEPLEPVYPQTFNFYSVKLKY